MAEPPDRADASRPPSGGWRVVDAQFVTSAPSVADCPVDDLPEFALAGRSNVGKSSLLNALCGRRGLARVSRTPGRTQLLNVFDLALAGPGGQRRALRCVDLPGYGYAAARRQVREGFAPMIEGYLEHRPALRALVLLVDARRGELSELDLQLLDFATAHGHPALLVATKIDRLGASERGLLRRRLAASVGARPRDVLLTSASANLGLSGPEGLAADLAALCEPGDVVSDPSDPSDPSEPDDVVSEPDDVVSEPDDVVSDPSDPSALTDDGGPSQPRARS